METATPDTLSGELDALAAEGFVILERILDQGEIAALRTALGPYLQGKHFGRNRFEGLRSQRVFRTISCRRRWRSTSGPARTRSRPTTTTAPTISRARVRPSASAPSGPSTTSRPP